MHESKGGLQAWLAFSPDNALPQSCSARLFPSSDRCEMRLLFTFTDVGSIAAFLYLQALWYDS